LSDGGVHSHIQHLFALLRMAREQHVERVLSTASWMAATRPPHSGVEFIQQLQQKMRETGCGRIASLTGRYYAMDRDNRWERVDRALSRHHSWRFSGEDANLSKPSDAATKGTSRMSSSTRS